MEPMVFSVFVVLFWTPAVVLLLIGLINYKKKQLRKGLILVSLLLFSGPFVLVLLTRINHYSEKYSFTGMYSGIDQFSNTITLEIRDNNTFQLTVDECASANKKGSWRYDKELNMTWLNADNFDISVQKDYNGGMTFYSDIHTDCCNLREIDLRKN